LVISDDSTSLTASFQAPIVDLVQQTHNPLVAGSLLGAEQAHNPSAFSTLM
jgi:hypothetical protein